MRLKRNHTRPAHTIASGNRSDRSADERIPNHEPMLGIKALSRNLSERRSVATPSSVNFNGPFSAQPRKLTAMPLSMMVVTTSWAPVLTLSAPAIPAKAMPPSIPKINTAMTSKGPGRKSSFSAAQVAVTMPTRYWPSTPMLNSPPLKHTATASAEKINGVAIVST